MRLEGRRRSTNIQDLRGSSSRGRSRTGFGLPSGQRRVRIPSSRRSPVRSSGGGIGSIVLLVVIFFALRSCGIDPLQILAGGGVPGGSAFDQLVPQTQTSRAPTPSVTRNDEQTVFISRVLAETEDVWNGVFQAEGGNYPEPTLVLFERQVASACGRASSSSGPFYCPADRKIYIDLNFFDQLADRFNASGDFAQAYVVAHEVGHHIQNIIGVLPRFNQMRRQMSQAEQNAMSVRVELQADCFAGIWGHFTEQKGLLERGDLEEALNAAAQIGDDAIQMRTRGFIVPESFSHGTSEQRHDWFLRGFETGRFAACDTFN
ncbi:MAG: neutral zinc metallopeptidase, partial [Pseudomonadota bacterium]